MRILLAVVFFLVGVSAHAREITFSWDPFENVYAYEIRVSKDPNFTEILLRKGTKKPSYTVELSVGQYYYKVRALDQNKRPGQWSPAVPVTVPPYPPELKAPKSGVVYSYFEVPPPITLEWKPVEGEIEYDVLITKTTGQKVLEKRTGEPKLATSEITEGEYMWKVKTIYQKIYESGYTEPKYFNVEQKPLSPPQLIEPIGETAIPAYRPLTFKWKRDPNTTFSDLQVKSTDADPPYLLHEKDLDKLESFDVPYMEPGEYHWNVTNKEAKSTPGVASKEETFEVRNDFVSGGNTTVSLGVAPSAYVVRGGGHEFARDTLAYYLDAKYFLGEVLGLSLSFQSDPIDRAPYTIPYQRTAANLIVRGGVPGFAQEWFIGYRSMDLIFSDPVNNELYFTTTGVQTGLNIVGTVARKWRFLLGALYYKPTFATANLGALTCDHYEAEIGFSKNIYDQFWLSYKFHSEKTVSEVGSGSTHTNFESFRTELIHLELSWEY